MLTLHIGVGKTATTTIQEIYFPAHPGIAYLGKARKLEGADRQLNRLMNRLVYGDGLAWDPAEMRAAMTPLVRDAEAKGLAPLYSNETIIDEDQDKGLTIQRLKETFGPCRILLSLREQCGFLQALYSHDNNKLKGLPGPCNGRFISAEQWLEYHAAQLERQRGWFWLVQYHRLARHLVETFGRENVHFLVFEQFVAAPRAFFREMCDFLGIEDQPDLADETANTRLNPDRADRWLQKHLYMQDLVRKGSLLAKNPSLLRLAGALYSNRHKKPVQLRVELPSEWTVRLQDLFRESNRALADDFGLDLAGYGYPL